jgi:hypothetical protein
LSLRLLRHILTVYHTQGKKAIDVIRSWPAQIKEQTESIDPTWVSADVTFNGYLPYELPLLKFYAKDMIEDALKTAKNENDKASIKIIERLESTLKGVVDIEAPDNIPDNSITQQYINTKGFYKKLLKRAGPEVSTTQTDDEISAMTALAKEAGEAMPVFDNERYNLLITSEFFKDKEELKRHQGLYGDRFNLDVVSGRSADSFINNVLTNPNAVSGNTIVLLPDELAYGKFEMKHYQMLKDKGIRFMMVNRNELLTAKAEKNEYRAKFQVDTYAMMLLMRAIDKNTTQDSPIYRLLSFYLKTHFNFKGNIAIDDYIMAISENEIGKLLQAILAYRPAKAYDKPDYKNVAATLIAA